MRIIAGALLLSLPIIGIVAATVVICGWRIALGMWSFSVIFTALITTGIFLLVGAE